MPTQQRQCQKSAPSIITTSDDQTREQNTIIETQDNMTTTELSNPTIVGPERFSTTEAQNNNFYNMLKDPKQVMNKPLSDSGEMETNGEIKQ